MNGTRENNLQLADLLTAKEHLADPNVTLDIDTSDERYGTLSPHEVDQSRRSTAYLDGLRGLACFLVYMAHHISAFYEDDIQHGFGYNGEKAFATLPFIRIFFCGGKPAVAIFFVLSGFVLSISPLRMLRDGQLRKCYDKLISASIRRPFRLYIPPIGVSLPFALIMQLPWNLAPQFGWPEAQGSILAELWNWVIELVLALNPFTKHSPATRWFAYDPPVWTMPVELQGSILVFALTALFSHLKPQYRLLLFTGICLILLFLSQWVMACFLAGMILAINDLDQIDSTLLLDRLSPRTKSLSFHTIFLTGWFLLSQPSGPYYDNERSYNTYGWYHLTKLVPKTYSSGQWWRFWIAIGAILLVYAVLKLRWLQRFLTLRPMRYLGKISFSLYLTHIPFLWVVGEIVYRLVGRPVRDQRQTWVDNIGFSIPDVGPLGLSTRFLAAQMIILPLNLIVSEIGTVVLDRPSIVIGKWVASRLYKEKSKSSIDSRNGYLPR